MKLRWLGHAAFRVETAKDTILIDPFLTHNPAFQGQDRKEATTGVTHILLTHGHMDHVGDTIDIAKETGAVVVANADLGDWLQFRGVENVAKANGLSVVLTESGTRKAPAASWVEGVMARRPAGGAGQSPGSRMSAARPA